MASRYQYRARVIRIIDGDTLVVDIDLGFKLWFQSVHVRLARVDTAEVRGAEREEGKEAREYVESLFDATDVDFHLVSLGRDKYGRVLGEVFLADGRNLSDLIIQNGMDKRTPC